MTDPMGDPMTDPGTGLPVGGHAPGGPVVDDQPTRPYQSPTP